MREQQLLQQRRGHGPVLLGDPLLSDFEMAGEAGIGWQLEARELVGLFFFRRTALGEQQRHGQQKSQQSQSTAVRHDKGS